MYQVEVLLVGTERLLKEPLLHGGPDVGTYGRNSQREQDVCPSGTTAVADIQNHLLFQLLLPSTDYAPSFLLSPLPASSQTVLTKTLASRSHYHPHRTHAATEAPTG